MKLSVTTSELARAYGDEYSLENLAKIGFDAVDYSMFIYGEEDNILDHPYDDYAAYFEKMCKVAKEAGIAVGQVHAPTPSYSEDPERNRQLYGRVVASIYAAGILESPYIVVHAPMMADCIYDQNKDKNRQICEDFYQSLIPHLEKTGVRLAVENMFNVDREKNRPCPTVCSTAEDMIYYVDTLGKNFVNCLDIGHVHVLGYDTTEMIGKLGDRLKVLHVHDNDGVWDNHTVPYHGNIDWAAVCGAIRNSGYSGTFSFEANAYGIRFPKELRLSAMTHLYNVGRYLLKTYF